MWYYESNHQPAGPVDEAEISRLLQSGGITALTLVWRDGMPDWKHLGETELSSLARSVAAPVQTTPMVGSVNPYANPVAPSAPVYPQYRAAAAKSGPRVSSSSLKSLFNIWVVLMLLTGVYEIISLMIPGNTSLAALSCIGSLVSLGAAVLGFILLYKFWQVNQDGRASTTPGKAVGFMFIPLFNIYWIFRAFPGLSLDQNRYIADHFGDRPEGTVKKANPVIAFAYIIFSFIGGIVIAIISASKAVSMASASMDTLNPTTLASQFTAPIAIFSIVMMLFYIWMYYGFYSTAKSICEAEEQVN